MALGKFYTAALIPLFLIAAAPVLSACQTPPAALSPQEEAAVLTVKGSATYRERMAAPKGSVLKVELSDTSRADAPAISLADWSDSLDDGGVPKKFVLRVNETLDPRFTYTLRATVTGPDGALLWTTDTVHQVEAVSGAVDAGMLVMVKVAPAPVPAAPLPEAPAPLKLTGKEYRVTAIAGQPVSGQRPMTVKFGEDGRVGGFGGCNTYGGSFGETDAKITFGDIISTMMACLDPKAGAQESALYAAFKGTATVAPGADGKVILTGGNGTQIELTPTGLKPLAGTSWQVETMGAAAIVAGSEPQITFTQDGQINGTTGCNRFFGAYAQTGAQITFSSVGMTKMACMADGIMGQEMAFTAILSGKTEGRIDSLGNLTVRGERGVSFTARPLGDAAEGDPAVLLGGAWQVEDLNRNGIIDNILMTLTFTADGNLIAFTPCGTSERQYTATGTTLHTSPGQSSMNANCRGESLQDQVLKLTVALGEEMAWRLTADGALELTREGGHRVLLRR